MRIVAKGSVSRKEPMFINVQNRSGKLKYWETLSREERTKVFLDTGSNRSLI